MIYNTVCSLLLREGEILRYIVRLWVINMWWINIVVPILMALGVYGFLRIVGVHTGWLTHKTHRRAEDMYDEFADSPGKRHRRS